MMKINAYGRVTIPKKYRNQYGLLPGVEIRLVPKTNGLRFVKVAKKRMK